METDILTNYAQMRLLMYQWFGNQHDKDIRGCHIGCFQGDMEVTLLDEFHRLTIVGIDPLGAYMKTVDGKLEMHPIDLASLRARHDLYPRFDFKMMTSDAAVKELQNEKFDYVYIDGDHHYHQVRRDILNYALLVKEGGIISGDDYREVSEYDEVTEQTLGPEVKQAVDRLFGKDLFIEDAGTWWAYKKDLKNASL